MPQSPTTSTDEPQRRAAHAAAAARVGIVVAAWLLARVMLSGASGHGARTLLDAALAAGTWWALMPGRAAGGPEFLRNDHWTKFLGAPLVLGVVLALLGAWRMLSGAS